MCVFADGVKYHMEFEMTKLGLKFAGKKFAGGGFRTKFAGKKFADGGFRI